VPSSLVLMVVVLAKCRHGFKLPDNPWRNPP
jgi:hypothetical protein